MNTWTVIVGNIGTVLSDDNEANARDTFGAYSARSRDGIGRGAHESVTLMCGDDIVAEYTPSVQTWNVRSLDVWGHSAADCECNCECDVSANDGAHADDCSRHDGCDGFTVNQSFAAGSIELAYDASDTAIIEAMIAAGYLKDAARTLAEVDDYSDGTMFDIVDASTGEPLYTLDLASE